MASQWSNNAHSPSFGKLALACRDMDEKMSELLDELQGLETELHRRHARRDRARLEELLHPGFREVGRSGCAYDRDTAIQHLLSQPAPPAIESWAFEVIVMDTSTALLTYRSAQRQQDGALSHHAHRSSIWLKGQHGWQVLYHQGTPMDATAP
jgi:hypothetical protein